MAHETKVDGGVGEHTRPPVRDLTAFDYAASAELFLGRGKAAKRRPRYKRFDTAAEAVRFVIEDLPATILPGVYLLVDEARFNVEEIRHLYESTRYPLSRDSEEC